jgi:cyclase
MFRARVIPCLLLDGGRLVKTVRFDQPKYVGDPVNAVRIFNDKEVDELVVLDISATRRRKEPDFELIADLASECFMPLAYGGGVNSLLHIERLFKLGLEKVMMNSAVIEKPDVVRQAARTYGNQSILVSMDVRRTRFRGYQVFVQGGKVATGMDPVTYARRAEELGAGELLLTSIDCDGMMQGYDLDLISRVAAQVQIPVVACGGAGSLDDLAQVIKGGASAAAAGSLFVFHGKFRAVLINYPRSEALDEILI